MHILSLHSERLDTILAALRWYQHSGMGDTDNRPDWLHVIADPDDISSLCDEGIDELCEAIRRDRACLSRGRRRTV